MDKRLAIVLGLASPLLALQLVKAILFAMNKLYDLMSDTIPSDATIVQAAIDLTSQHSTLIAFGLAAFAIYTYLDQAKRKSIS